MISRNMFVLAFAILIVPMSVEASDIEKAKKMCLSIGFSAGTDSYSDCALKIYQKLKKQNDTNEINEAKRQDRERQATYERNRREAERSRLAEQQRRLAEQQRQTVALQQQQLELQRQRLEEAKRARRAEAWDSLSRALLNFSQQPAAQPSFPRVREPLNCYSSSNGYGVSTSCQ